MIRKLIAILLLCNPGFAAVCTSQGTGNWDVITWSCGHAPTTSDSTVIATGNTVTVENGLTTAKTTGITFSGTNPTLVVASGGTLNAGTLVENGATVLFHAASGATVNLGTNTNTTNTLDITITLGTFTIDNGATFTTSGTFKSGPTGTANLNGRTICQPASETVHQIIEGNSSSTGSAVLSFVGASHGSPAVIETGMANNSGAGQNSGQQCLIQATGGSSVSDLLMNHVIVNRMGDSAGNSINWVTQTTPGSVTLNDVLFNNFGQIAITTNSGVSNASTFAMANLSFRNADNAVYFILGSTNTTVPSAPRLISGVTCDSETFTGAGVAWNVTGSNFNFGSSTLYPSNGASDTVGINSLNCNVTMSGVNNIEENWLPVIDNTLDGAIALTINYSTNNILQNSAFYAHDPNVHVYQGATAGSSTQNYVIYNFGDGDMWVPADSGSLCIQSGTSTCSNNILVNGNLNLANPVGLPTSLIMDNNLEWNQASLSLGESSINALSVQDLYDNVWDCPLCLVDVTTYPPAGTCGAYTFGVTEISLYQTQTNMNEDNNWKYNFPNEGDPLSYSCTSSKTNGVHPFLGIYGAPISAYRGASALNNLASTGSTGTNCPGSSCELDYATGGFTSGTGDQIVQVNDLLYNDTRNTWTTINTVSSNTKVLLNQGTVGTLTTLSSGDHFSINKGMWADHTAIGAATNRGLHDVHSDPILFNAGVGVCTWFNTIGGALTCPTVISGSGATDTNVLTVGHAVVTYNGWDYGSAGSLTGTNCAVNCPAPVTPWNHTATELLKYIGQNYRIYNGAAKNSGHTGSDIGPAWQTNFPTAFVSF